MWNKYKSAVLSHFAVQVLMVLTVAAACFIPKFVDIYCRTIEPQFVSVTRVWLMITLYATFPAALLSELCLHNLLVNIKKDAVFVPENVKYMRYISWCCFAVAIIYFILGFRILLAFAIAAAAALFGLILRVIKNVFTEAVEIKFENDLTI